MSANINCSKNTEKKKNWFTRRNWPTRQRRVYIFLGVFYNDDNILY